MTSDDDTEYNDTCQSLKISSKKNNPGRMLITCVYYVHNSDLVRQNGEISSKMAIEQPPLKKVINIKGFRGSPVEGQAWAPGRSPGKQKGFIHDQYGAAHKRSST